MKTGKQIKVGGKGEGKEERLWGLSGKENCEGKENAISPLKIFSSPSLVPFYFCSRS